jgi:hypothetical protein
MKDYIHERKSELPVVGNKRSEVSVGPSNIALITTQWR